VGKFPDREGERLGLKPNWLSSWAMKGSKPGVQTAKRLAIKRFLVTRYWFLVAGYSLLVAGSLWFILRASIVEPRSFV